MTNDQIMEAARLIQKIATLEAVNEPGLQPLIDRDKASLAALRQPLPVTQGDEEVARLREALELADAALRGANMNMAIVERKVRAALSHPKKGRGDMSHG